MKKGFLFGVFLTLSLVFLSARSYSPNHKSAYEQLYILNQNISRLYWKVDRLEKLVEQKNFSKNHSGISFQIPFGSRK